jgi:hypothetical protein
MEIKNLFPKAKEQANDGPWVIEEISNGLKARNVTLKYGVVRTANKNIPVQFFEYDRIFGKGAFLTTGILKVMDMFNELQELTPETSGYVFKDAIYLYHSKGILKRNNRSNSEEFYSIETLKNKALASYLKLDHQDPDYERDSNRSEVHSGCTELQTVQD